MYSPGACRRYPVYPIPCRTLRSRRHATLAQSGADESIPSTQCARGRSGHHQPGWTGAAGRTPPRRRLGFIYVTSSADFFTGEPQGYIVDVAVSEEAEGTGVASMLMKHAETWARTCGFRILALDVFAMNAHARSFYQYLGYVEETLKLIKEL